MDWCTTTSSSSNSKNIRRLQRFKFSLSHFEEVKNWKKNLLFAFYLSIYLCYIFSFTNNIRNGWWLNKIETSWSDLSVIFIWILLTLLSSVDSRFDLCRHVLDKVMHSPTKRIYYVIKVCVSSRCILCCIIQGRFIHNWSFVLLRCK